MKKNNKFPNPEDMMKAHIADFEKNRDKISIQMESDARSNRTCLSHWYPLIQKLPNIKTPETEFYYLHFDKQLHALENPPSAEFLEVVEKIKEKGRHWGYPLFIKNSLFSAKHSWKDTCFVEKEEDIISHFLFLTDMAYAFGVEPSLYWVVRKYIKPDALIYTDSNMPVTFERRYFLEDGKVKFHHPYWPESALLNQSPSPENWKELLVKTNYESDEEIALLKKLTEEVGSVLSGEWSVDWLKVGNQWYLIDMAEKHKSFMWKDYHLGLKGL